MLIGVDAGGSRTTAAVANASSRVLARAEAGAGALRPGQAAVAAAAIFAAARDALQRARLRPPAEAMVIGASGASDPAEREALGAALEGCGLATRLVIVTDAEIALEAAFGKQPGIVLIAGTGSVAWARLPDGSSARAGGLGPVLGDRGSGHDLGREALRTIGAGMELGLALDLAKAVATHLGIGEEELSRWSLGASVSAVAALGSVLLDAARTGDTVARTIALQSARALAALATTLAARFPRSAPATIAWGGGLLASQPGYRTMVIECLREDLPGSRIAESPIDAVLGAISMARQLGTD
ncbi:MAG TPA: BadF/BadG/BcrA/BcrD ATPase family protein [Gemmatimonadales bacterium]|jgi:glucosamine kinase